MEFIRWGGKNEKSRFIYGEYDGFLSALAKEGIIPAIVNKFPLEVLSQEEIAARFEKYIDRLLAFYSVDEIIFVDVWHTTFYTDHQSMFLYEKHESYERENRRIEIGYQIMKEKLKGCHRIPMPEWVVGSQKHHLGKYPMHYTKEFYDYAFKCVEIITMGLEKPEEEKAIRKLCKECSELYFSRYFKYLKKSFVEKNKQLEKEITARKKLDIYTKFFLT